MQVVSYKYAIAPWKTVIQSVKWFTQKEKTGENIFSAALRAGPHLSTLRKNR
jgi:hypothetical protein